MNVVILKGDALTRLRGLPDGSVDCIITSPPYWRLRRYPIPDMPWPRVRFTPMHGLRPVTIPPMTCQLGQEKDPLAFVGHLVLIFREAARVLKKTGTLWLNMNDTAASSGSGVRGRHKEYLGADTIRRAKHVRGLHRKDLVGIPWRLAFALQADKWVLRMDHVWRKRNVLPESVRDRCTREHEYVFLFARTRYYFYNQEATLVPCSENTHARVAQPNLENQNGSIRANGGTRADRPTKTMLRAPGVNPKAAAAPKGVRSNSSFSQAISSAVPSSRRGPPRGHERPHSQAFDDNRHPIGDRNLRSVWDIPTVGTKGSHYATFPPSLPEICLKAGCPPGGTVLDLFAGSGTVARVAADCGMNAILIEPSDEYIAEARQRVRLMRVGGEDVLDPFMNVEVA